METRRTDALAATAVAFLAANLLHGADHLRKGVAGLASRSRPGERS